MEKTGTKRNNTKKIAVTGGIGSGKSTVCRMIRELGYPVFSCDAIYKDLQRDSAYLSVLKNAFDGVVENGALNTEKLSAIVFSNPSELDKLNAIAHPLIMQKLYDCMENYAISFAEVPLLFESNRQNDFDGVIVVYRELEMRVNAVCTRDNTDREKVLSRIKNQADYEKIIKEGHTVIYNDGDVNSLKEKVIKTLEKILS